MDEWTKEIENENCIFVCLHRTNNRKIETTMYELN